MQPQAVAPGWKGGPGADAAAGGSPRLEGGVRGLMQPLSAADPPAAPPPPATGPAPGLPVLGSQRNFRRATTVAPTSQTAITNRSPQRNPAPFV
jgi:hypothetical protein